MGRQQFRDAGPTSPANRWAVAPRRVMFRRASAGRDRSGRPTRAGRDPRRRRTRRPSRSPGSGRDGRCSAGSGCGLLVAVTPSVEHSCRRPGEGRPPCGPGRGGRRCNPAAGFLPTGRIQDREAVAERRGHGRSTRSS